MGESKTPQMKSPLLVLFACAAAASGFAIVPATRSAHAVALSTSPACAQLARVEDPIMAVKKPLKKKDVKKVIKKVVKKAADKKARDAAVKARLFKEAQKRKAAENALRQRMVDQERNRIMMSKVRDRRLAQLEKDAAKAREAARSKGKIFRI